MAIVSSGQARISDSFLALASGIVRNSQSQEGPLRTAISRAYYSVFLTVRDRLFGSDAVGLTADKKKSLNRRFNKKHKRSPGSHDIIAFALTDLPPTSIMNSVTFSQKLSQLKEARIHSDYDFTEVKLQGIPYDTWLEYADQMVAFASQLLAEARHLPSYP